MVSTLPALLMVLGTGAMTAAAEAEGVAQTPGPTSASTLIDRSARFDSELRLLFRMVACTGAEPVPTGLEAVVARHCELFQPTIENYRTRYLPVAQPFLVALQPKGLPGTVVYPFGGGDLLSALTTYPSLREVTTLSLEHVGDPRVVNGITAKTLEAALEKVRRRVSGLLIWTESTSENMIQLEAGEIPGQLAFFLVGLAVHGQEPLSLRYFDLSSEGEVVGISDGEIEARKEKIARKLNPVWKAPSFSDAFSNSEITFRKASDPNAPVRIHRHLAADLSNAGLRRDPAVLKHLQSKGRISAMTKAASYLLWRSDFSAVCNYLLANVEFMLSDSTGIPPRLSAGAGFEVLAYGRYTGPFLQAPSAAARDMLKLFATQPPRDLGFRYGYPDKARHDHLIVVRKPEKPPR
jgi:hypothetical protein